MKNPQIKAPRISIAVRAWNEEVVIRRTLESLFQQSLFEELSARGEHCEVLCIPNGCADRTAEIAAEVFAGQEKSNSFTGAFACSVRNIREAGRNHTWNAFVHTLSHPEAEFLFLMDSDIFFDRRETLFSMYRALLENPEASVASDQPVKDVSLKPLKSWRDRISLATSAMNGALPGQMTGQLYCIRTAVARRLYLPKDLGIDDGFIKAIVCTDFFSKALNPSRIVVAPNASHVYEAYTSAGELLKNQKRQMIGQTIVHVLVEYAKALPQPQRTNLGDTLRREERACPDWVARLVAQHLQRVHFFWRLFPDAPRFRFKRWWRMRGMKRVTHLPATLVGFAVTMLACAQAFRHFKRGKMHFWPKAGRENIRNLATDETRLAHTLETS
ncbi:MAG TPA: glycosyltransferase [Candidatus Acidoferrum sp.]|jgi:glycosyltransferase involved in cell wall biosynthesis|nr:glycosyltransferase [Candidatus Acidoferrum sp.]